MPLPLKYDISEEWEVVNYQFAVIVAKNTYTQTHTYSVMKFKWFLKLIIEHNHEASFVISIEI